MQEMRQVIGLRQGEYTPRSRTRSVFDGNRTLDKTHFEGIIQAVGDLTAQTDKDLNDAFLHQEKLQESLKKLVSDFREVCQVSAISC
jgi:hypothetical protein